jgi:hypothetical protein
MHARPRSPTPKLPKSYARLLASRPSRPRPSLPRPAAQETRGTGARLDASESDAGRSADEVLREIIGPLSTIDVRFSGGFMVAQREPRVRHAPMKSSQTAPWFWDHVVHQGRPDPRDSDSCPERHDRLRPTATRHRPCPRRPLPCADAGFETLLWAIGLLEIRGSNPTTAWTYSVEAAHLCIELRRLLEVADVPRPRESREPRPRDCIV